MNIFVSHVSSKEFLDIQVTIERRFTLKSACDMIITSSQLRNNGSVGNITTYEYLLLKLDKVM